MPEKGGTISSLFSVGTKITQDWYRRLLEGVLLVLLTFIDLILHPKIVKGLIEDILMMGEKNKIKVYLTALGKI